MTDKRKKDLKESIKTFKALIGDLYIEIGKAQKELDLEGYRTDPKTVIGLEEELTIGKFTGQTIKSLISKGETNYLRWFSNNTDFVLSEEAVAELDSRKTILGPNDSLPFGKFAGATTIASLLKDKEINYLKWFSNNTDYTFDDEIKAEIEKAKKTDKQEFCQETKNIIDFEEEDLPF